MCCSNPFKYSSIFIDNFALLKVQILTGILSWHFYEGLIQENRVVDIFLQFEKSVQSSTEKLWMTESICNVLVFFLRPNWNIVLISFGMIVIARNWAIEPLFFPLNDMLESWVFVPRGIGYKSIFIEIGKRGLFINISSRKTEIR